MNASKQLVNLLGVMVVLGILVAGLVLIALPMYSQSQTTDGSTREVAQTNEVYEIALTGLTEAESRITEIDEQLASLRTEISAETKYDDVFEIIAASAADADLTVESITMTEPEAFVARPAVVDAAGTGLPVELVTSDAESEPTPDQSSTSDAPLEDDVAATADVEGAPALGQLQSLITVEATTDEADAAMDFVDGLRVGPRLILPINATLIDGKLTLTALTFIRTED